MPTWLMYAMIPTLLYSVINHIDKGLLDRYFKEGGTEVLLLFSTLFAVFGVPYAIWMNPDVLSISEQNVGIMAGVAALNALLLFCYLKALEEEDPTVVILYYQLVPVMTLGLGYRFLGETISTVEAIAMVLILLGTTLATFQRTELKTFKFRWRTFGFMSVASGCWAAEMTFGKIVIIDESVYHSIFWESAIMVLIGVIIYAARPKARSSFKNAWKVNSKWILGLMIFSEVIYVVGNIFSAFASELKEVALVMLTQPLQSIFVFIFGLGLALFWPKIYAKRLSRFDIIQKLLAIAITGAGTYLLVV